MPVAELRRSPVEGALVGWLLARPPSVERLPVGALEAPDLAAELRRLEARRAMDAAYEAELVMALAADSGAPEPGDPRPGAAPDGAAEGPIPGTSEFFVDELAMILNCTARSAARRAAEAHLLTGRMAPVRAALAAGRLDVPRARVFLDVLGATAAGVAEAVAPRVLPDAAGLSLGRLRARLTREALAEDEQAAEARRAQAERAAGVRVFPVGDGMSELVADLPAPVAAACWSTIDQLAWMRRNDGDERPIGQLRSLVHADLILRPWDTTRPPVTANLTVIAPLDALAGDAHTDADAGARADVAPADVASHAHCGGDGGLGAVAEVDGQPITAAHVRELLARLDAVCPGGLQAPTGGSLQIAVTDENGALLATTSRPELERVARRGCPDHQTIECGCAVLSAPPAVDRYVPTPGQRRFVTTRDRSCRMPNCGQPVGRVDLDHVRAYADGGPTDCDNLCCLCRHHHRLKTHAPGWRFVLTDHGVLRVTTPTGITRSTRPPGLRDRIEQRALPAPPPPPGGPQETPPF